MASHHLGVTSHDILPLGPLVISPHGRLGTDGALDPVTRPFEVTNPGQLVVTGIPVLQGELAVQAHQLWRLIGPARALVG